MDDTLTLRTYQPGDEVRLNELFNRVFGEQRQLELWRWQFLHNPVGLKSTWYLLAEHCGAIVGQYATLPRRFCYRGTPILATQPVDSFIDPSVRRGIRPIKAMFTQSVTNLKQGGGALGFGFPNPGHYKVGKRLLGYADLGCFRPLFLRLNWHSAIARRLPLPQALLDALRSANTAFTRRWLMSKHRCEQCRTSIKRVDRFDARFDRLWERNRLKSTLIGVRDQRELQWRFFDKPGTSYEVLIAEETQGEISGYVVYKIGVQNGTRVGYIVDLLCDHHSALHALAFGVLKDMNDSKVDCVLCWMTPNATSALLREHWGFVEAAHFDPIPIVYYLGVGELDPADAADASRWYLTYSDMDTM